MILKKKVSVGADFAKVGEDLKDGDLIKVNSEGQDMEGEWGTRTIFKIETRNGEKALSFNQTSINNLIDAFGEDTGKWVGKQVKVWLLKQMVQGKLKNITYITAPDWTMNDEGKFSPTLNVKIDDTESPF